MKEKIVELIKHYETEKQKLYGELKISDETDVGLMGSLTTEISVINKFLCELKELINWPNWRKHETLDEYDKFIQNEE